MPPRTLPAIEQLEERCVPSAAALRPYTASAAPAPVPEPQTTVALVQAVRGHVDHGAAGLPPTAPLSVIQTPPPSIAVNVPQPVGVDQGLMALAVEPPAAAELAAVSAVVDEPRAAEAATALPTAAAAVPVAVVVTPIEHEADFVVPAATEAHSEPVRTSFIPVAMPVTERAAPTDAAALHDHLPALVWMLGIASLVALRSEWRRQVTSVSFSCFPLDR